VSVVALVIPADPTKRWQTTELALTAGAFSDAIGCGLLDEALIDTLDGLRYCIYADADRHEHHLPDNTRAITLAKHLGWADLIDTFHLLGDILIVGADDHGHDTDLPTPALLAAQSTLPPHPRP
jgi:hypothetical protein